MRKKHFQLFLAIFLSSTFLHISSYAQCPQGGAQSGGIGSGGNTLIDAVKNFLEWVVYGIQPLDPNEITGPKGFAEKQFVSAKQKMGFRVDFENDGEFATAPAQNVFINVPVDPKININSFRLGSFGFGRYNFQVPENSTYYTTRLDVRDSLGLFVDVTAGIDIVKNELFWIFRSVEPVTGLAPANALKGFLAVSDTASTLHLDSLANKGQGYVNFFISPANNAITGDTTSAIATIIFDNNESMATNTWTNTIDALSPKSKVEKATLTDKNRITLNWSGSDDAGGSGVRDYALYVSENGGIFNLYKDKIADQSTSFTGTPGKTYCFFTLATDNTGNQETLKKNCEFSIQLTPEGTLPITWLYFKGQQQVENVLLTWATVTEKNTKEFIIERSVDGRQFTAIGAVSAAGNNNQTNNYLYLDKNISQLNTKVVYYRLRQVDIDGNFTYSIIVAIPISKTSLEPIVKAYPNPFAQNITLQILNVTASQGTDKVELYSLEGKLLYQRRLVNRGSATVLLNDLPLLRPGVYMLKTVIDRRLFTIKMVRR